jgi:hypothetical protein
VLKREDGRHQKVDEAGNEEVPPNRIVITAKLYKQKNHHEGNILEEDHEVQDGHVHQAKGDHDEEQDEVVVEV